MKRFLAAVVLGFSLVGVAHAAIDTYEFAKEGDRERFRELTKDCLLYTSPSPRDS